MKFVFSKVSISVLVFLVVGFSLISLSKEDKLSHILKTFNAYHIYYSHDKIYIHTDKSYYTLGENIWFKTYLINGNNQPDTLSGVVYVELISQKREVVRELILKADSSTCRGNLFLTDTLSPGTYQLRAYTNYMRNLGVDFFFKKNIPVFPVGYKKYNWQITQIQSDIKTEDDFLYKIVLLDKNNQPKTDFPVQYKIKAKGLKTIKGKLKTTLDGSFRISLNIPVNKQIANCTIEFSVPEDSQKWSYDLPVRKGLPLVRFFPEGGNFVDGIENNVAFKITGELGLGIKTKVQVFNQDSMIVANSNSNQFGMGAFKIIPKSGEKYYSYISFNGVSYGKYYLSKVQKNGYVLHVNNLNNDSIYIKAVRNFNINEQESWSIICQTKGKVIYRVSGVPRKGELIASIPKRNLLDGVYQITLFDQDIIPQSERLIFINSGKKPAIELIKTRLEDRTYNFTVLLKDSIMRSANISVSIINKNIVEDLFPFQDNIFSYLELTSELRGKIESPNYYFIDNSLKRLIDLDYLLMTQGWRKFVWKDMLEGKIPDYNYPVEDAIKVSGKIVNYNNKIKEGDEVTLMLFEDGNTQIFQSKTDSLGRFIFYADFFDTVKAVIQTRKKRSNVDRKVVLDEHSVPMIDNIVQFIPGKKAYQSINKIKNSGQVREVIERMYEFDTDYTIPEVTIKGVNWVWRHNKEPEKVLMVEDMEEDIVNRNRFDYYSVLHFIADNFSGATLRSNNFHDYLFVHGIFALVVLDGEAFLGDDYFTFLPQVDWHSLKKIEILTTGACKYANAPCWIPVICLYSNPDRLVRVSHIGIRKFNLTGYYRAREFYYPITSEDVSRNIPEYSSTVYWNPELKCDSSGIFSFHVNRKSLPENIDICIEGITDYGRPVYSTFNISR